MPRDMQPFADVVLLAIQAAQAPVLERLASAEARLALVDATDAKVTALRDRMLVSETKAAAVVPTDLSELTDLRDRIVACELKAAGPPLVAEPDQVMFERLVAAEGKMSDVRDRLLVVETKAAAVVPPDLSVIPALRDRIVACETKAAVPLPEAQPIVMPDPVVLDRLTAVESRLLAADTKVPASPVDLSPVLERLAATEARLDTLGDLRDRVVTMETKAAQPVLTAVENVSPVDLAPLTAQVSALRERVGVMEVRAQIPGPPGRDGADGKDGRDGLNGTDGAHGADGMGFGDLAVVQDSERAFTVKAQRGLQINELGTLIFPVEIYRGVFVEGKTYERGDCVTWGGSEWHCNETTATKPGDGSKAWTLKVKRGRDGKDGRDGTPIATPVVSVARR